MRRLLQRRSSKASSEPIIPKPEDLPPARDPTKGPTQPLSRFRRRRDQTIKRETVSSTTRKTSSEKKLAEELAIEEFRARQTAEALKHARIWSTADFPDRNYEPVRPFLVDGRKIEEVLPNVPDSERTDFLNETLGLTEEHLRPYPTLDKDDPDIESKIDFIQLVSDFRYFCESFLRIDSKKQQVVDFKLNPIQLHFIFHRTGFDVINKGRQHGFTTLMLAYYLWNTIFNDSTVTFIITHKRQATKKMIAKVRAMWACLPDCIRPALLTDRDDHLRFATGSEIQCEVYGDIAGRSFTCNNLLCSEVAFWNIDDEQLAGFFDSVPEGGLITLESTPACMSCDARL